MIYKPASILYYDIAEKTINELVNIINLRGYCRRKFLYSEEPINVYSVNNHLKRIENNKPTEELVKL